MAKKKNPAPPEGGGGKKKDPKPKAPAMGKLVHLKGDNAGELALPPAPEDDHDLLVEIRDTYDRLAKSEAELEGYQGKVKTARERKKQIERELRHLLVGQRVLAFGEPGAEREKFDVCEPDGKVTATYDEGDPRLADARKNKKLVVRPHAPAKKGHRVAGDGLVAKVTEVHEDGSATLEVQRGLFAAGNTAKAKPPAGGKLSQKDKAAGEREDPEEEEYDLDLGRKVARLAMSSGLEAPTLRRRERPGDFMKRQRAWCAEVEGPYEDAKL